MIDAAEVAKEATAEILTNLGGCGFRDLHPDAYIELLKYGVDISYDIERAIEAHQE